MLVVGPVLKLCSFVALWNVTTLLEDASVSHSNAHLVLQNKIIIFKIYKGKIDINGKYIYTHGCLFVVLRYRVCRKPL